MNICDNIQTSNSNYAGSFRMCKLNWKRVAFSKYII